MAWGSTRACQLQPLLGLTGAGAPDAHDKWMSCAGCAAFWDTQCPQTQVLSAPGGCKNQDGISSGVEAGPDLGSEQKLCTPDSSLCFLNSCPVFAANLRECL